MKRGATMVGVVVIAGVAVGCRLTAPGAGAALATVEASAVPTATVDAPSATAVETPEIAMGPTLTKDEWAQVRAAIEAATRGKDDPRVQVSRDAAELLKAGNGVWHESEVTPTKVTVRWTFDLGHDTPSGLHHRRWFDATLRREAAEFKLESIHEGHAWPRR